MILNIIKWIWSSWTNIFIFAFICAGIFMGLIILYDYQVKHPAETYPSFLLPISGARIPQGPGLLPNASRHYRNGVHEGIDFGAPEGTAVKAARDGTVIKVVNGFLKEPEKYSEEVMKAAIEVAKAGEFERVRNILEGASIEIEHRFKNEIWKTRYLHLGSIMVEEGQKVKKGWIIAGVGNTGYSLQSHLLFVIIKPNGDFLGKGYDDDFELQWLLHKYLDY